MAWDRGQRVQLSRGLWIGERGGACEERRADRGIGEVAEERQVKVKRVSGGGHGGHEVDEGQVGGCVFAYV